MKTQPVVPTRRGGSRYKLLRPGGAEGDPNVGSRYKLLRPGGAEGDPNVLHIFLFFSVLPLFVYCTQ